MAKTRRRSGERFRLLIYERMWKRWAMPCFLIIPASVALWWFMPRLLVAHPLYRALALVPGLIAMFILVFTFMARRLAWVQCRSNNLRIQTLFYPLTISYGRIKEVVPQPFNNIFNPAEEKTARRNWLGPYWGKTVLVVRLRKLPVNKRWLRLWFSPYLLTPDTPGFVFVVEDWMALSRQLEDFRTAWVGRRARQRQKRVADRAW